LGGILKTVAFIFISPVAGLLLGLVVGTGVYWLFRNSSPFGVDHIFRKGQLVSAALYSLGHGGNDAQKTMGIIASLLFSAGVLGPSFTFRCGSFSRAMGRSRSARCAGVADRENDGQRVTKLKPVDGFCAETSAAVMLFVSTGLGIPVSTTHTITGAIMGSDRSGA